MNNAIAISDLIVLSVIKVSEEELAISLLKMCCHLKVKCPPLPHQVHVLEH